MLKPKKIVVVDIIAVIIIVFTSSLYLIFGGKLKLDVKFDTDTEITNQVILNSNKMFVIDNGKARIVKLVDEKVEFEVYGDCSDTSFMQAESLVVDDNDSFYVHNIVWDDSGFLLAGERIIHYDKNGKFDKIIYEKLYETKDNVNKRRIFNVRYTKGNIEFIYADDNGFSRMKIANMDKKEVTATQIEHYDMKLAVTIIQNFAFDDTTNRIYMADKRGKISYACNGEITDYFTANGKDIIEPYSVATDDNGVVYFSELIDRCIYKIEESDKEYGLNTSIKKIIDRDDFYEGLVDDNRGIFYNFTVGTYTVNKVRKNVIAVPYDNNIYIVEESGKIYLNQSNFKAKVSYVTRQLLILIMWVLIFISIVYLAIRIIMYLFRKRKNIKKIYKYEIMIVMSVIVVIPIVMFILIGIYRDMYTKEIAKRLTTVSTIAGNILDGKQVEKVKEPSNYMDDNYAELLKNLRNITSKNYDSNERFGAEIAKYEDGMAYAIMFPDTSIGTYYPLDGESASDVKEIYETKETKINLTVLNGGGTFIYARTPILNNGEVVGVISVCKDNVIVNIAVKKMIKDITLIIISCLVSVIIIFNSVVHFISRRGKNKD